MTSHHSNDERSCAERRRAITRTTTGRVPRDDGPSLERRPVVCREMTGHHSNDDRSCAERRRAITGAMSGRVPRDDGPSLRATTVHHAGGVIDQGGSLAPYPVIETPITPNGVIDQGASLASHPLIDTPIARDG